MIILVGFFRKGEVFIEIRVDYVMFSGKSILSRRGSYCKGFGVGTGLVC